MFARDLKKLFIVVHRERGLVRDSGIDPRTDVALPALQRHDARSGRRQSSVSNGGLHDDSVGRGCRYARHFDTTICAGTYAEQVMITKPVQLYGDNGAIVMPTSMTANVSASESTAAIIAVVNTENVNILGLTIDGSKNGISECAPFLVGVYSHGSSGTLYQTAVRNVALTPDLSGCQSGDAVEVDSLNSPVKVYVSNNSISGYQKNGVTTNDTGTIVAVQNNTIRGVGPTTSTARKGVQMGFGAGGSIVNNIVSNNIYSPCTNVSTCTTAATGILVFESSGIAVYGNGLDSNQLSIYAQGDLIGVQRNVISHSIAVDGITLAGNRNLANYNRVFQSDDAGVVIAGNNNQVSDNEIGEAPTGIVVVTGSPET